jgi:hypothetical protein
MVALAEDRKEKKLRKARKDQKRPERRKTRKTKKPKRPKKTQKKGKKTKMTKLCVKILQQEKFTDLDDESLPEVKLGRKRKDQKQTKMTQFF